MSNYRKYWVGLNMIKGIGAARLRAMLDFFGDVQSVWHAPADALRNLGLPTSVTENLIKFRSDVNLDEIFERIQRQNIQVVIWDDDDYPFRLREINNPPPVLYVRGKITTEDEWSVAVVGTRRITPYGQQVAERIATKLASSGITVVSGLALGVDTVAHQGSLSVGGRSLAVSGRINSINAARQHGQRSTTHT